MRALLLILAAGVNASALPPQAPPVIERPPQAPPVIKKQPVIVQPAVIATHGPHWTHPGTIYNHLISEHGFSSQQLAGLTTDQMKTLHDQAHNAKAAKVAAPVYQSGCPGGVCPVPQQSSRRGIFGGRW